MMTRLSFEFNMIPNCSRGLRWDIDLRKAAGGMQGLWESKGIMMEHVEQRGDARRLVYDI